MELSALLTSAGINIGVCLVIFSLYSILRKQPRFMNVYFGQKLAQMKLKRHDPFCFERLVPSASWMVKAIEASDDEIYASGGLDAVVFVRSIVFSMRIFSIAAIICLFMVLPFNYYGKGLQEKDTPGEGESLEVFSIANVETASKWLWAHCFALYIISCCTCALLYLEYKNITRMRLSFITSSFSCPSLFTVVVRGIPWSPDESYGVVVEKFFSNYYASSYLSHQVVYHSGAVQKLMNDAERMCQLLKIVADEQTCRPSLFRCGLCGGTARSFKILSVDVESGKSRSNFNELELRKKECASALVFFRTRYAAFVASQALQCPNPMTWVIEKAPAPTDVYWSNLFLPYRILWFRRIVVLAVSILFVAFFLVPVTLTQSLVNLEKLQLTLPFLKGILKRKYMSQLVTGYLPSVILMLFLYIAPPVMILLSTLEGAISRSSRKRSACLKLLYFMIWNVFFANILTGTLIKNFVGEVARRLSDPKMIPNALATAIPKTASFFMTYVLTSGWASLSCEILQPLPLLCNFIYRYVLRNKDECTYGTWTFPYHTEVPRILLFGILGFTCSINAPLILPILLVYYFLAYLVYRNQILNVYVTRYQTGGQYWPIVHNTTIFSLLLTQIIALGVFGLKESTVASSFTVPLVICTLLFNAYCRKRFLPIFRTDAAQTLIDMDRQDEQNQTLAEIHEKLPTAYLQFPHPSPQRNFELSNLSPQQNKAMQDISSDNCETSGTQDVEDICPCSGETVIQIPESRSEHKQQEIEDIL